MLRKIRPNKLANDGSKDYIPPTRPTQTLPFTYVCPLPYYSSAPKRPTACVALDSTTDLVMVPVHFRRLGSSAVEQGNHNPLVGSSNLSRATNIFQMIMRAIL